MSALGEDGYMSPVYRAIRSGALSAHQPTKKYLVSEAAYFAWVTQPPSFVPPKDAPSVRPSAPVESGSSAELLAIEPEAA